MPGRGSYDFVQWLRKHMGDEFRIYDPIIEKPNDPTYPMWKEMIDTELRSLKGTVYLIGHSLGGSTLLKYLSEETCKLQIAGLFLIAPPYWGKAGWDAEEFELKNDLSKTLPDIPEIHLYHCLHDPVVPVDHAKFYHNLIPSALIHMLKGNDHSFSNGLPLLLDHMTSNDIRI